MPKKIRNCEKGKVENLAQKCVLGSVQLSDMSRSPTVFPATKSRRIRWTGNAARMIVNTNYFQFESSLATEDIVERTRTYMAD